MAELVILYGKSGAGKSYSICSFGEREILLYQCEGKRLPARNSFQYVMRINLNRSVPDNINVLKNALLKMPTMAAVIDDLTYIPTNMFMAGHREKSGSKSFDLYDDIADAIWGLFRFVKDCLPDDKIVYFVMHEDTTDYGDTKLKTIGKLLDNKVCLEGMVTICLRCVSSMGKHFIRTQTDGNDVTKSPVGMFDADEIPNDLRAVDSTIREYYRMAPLVSDDAENTTAKAENEKESA